MTATHFLADRNGRQVAMICGLRGSDERRAGFVSMGEGEFTTTDGREMRLNYTPHRHDVTCKRCIAKLATKSAAA